MTVLQWGVYKARLGESSYIPDPGPNLNLRLCLNFCLSRFTELSPLWVQMR